MTLDQLRKAAAIATVFIDENGDHFRMVWHDEDEFHVDDELEEFSNDIIMRYEDYVDKDVGFLKLVPVDISSL